MKHRRLALVVMTVFLALVGGRCQESDTATSTGGAGQAAWTLEPGQTLGPLRLAPQGRWQRLNPEGPALFSPRVSPNGGWVAAAGRGGVGLFVANLRSSAPLLLVDRDRRGPWGWSAAPLGLHFGGDLAPFRVWRPGSGTTGPRGGVVHPASTAARGLSPARPWDRAWDEELGEAFHQGASGTWWHHPRHGTVTWQAQGQAPQTVVGDDAWGARASHCGRWVAFSTGLLAESWLRVHDSRVGVTRELGPGVHPVWLPDQGVLIYAVPEGVERLPGVANVTGSELWLFDGRTGDHRPMTATSDLAEMEPEVSPGGDAVIFADWRGGGLWRAALWGGGSP